MKALIYVNKEKDPNQISLNALIDVLNNEDVAFKVIDDNDLSGSSGGADVLFVLGGDGTILCLTEFAYRNDISIIGFNVGKLGFLTEFELCDMKNAVIAVKNGQLVEDKRLAISAEFNGTTYYALNDIVIQRVYIEQISNRIISVGIEIDNNKVDQYVGEGVLVTTPTGSTAYSFSAGGAILAPGTQAFSLTPIASHSFNNRPVVFSANCQCKMTLKNDSKAGVFIDGRFVGLIEKDGCVTISKAQKSIVFLRKENYDFYKVLFKKLKDSRFNV